MSITSSLQSCVLTPVYEQNLAQDSYFYQSYWCIESNKPKSIMVGTTAFAGSIKNLPVDATQEVLQAVELYNKLIGLRSRFEGLDSHYAFGMNETCVIRKGRKFPVGTRVQIAGEVRFDKFGTRKVLVRFIDTGSLCLVAVDNLSIEAESFSQYLECQGYTQSGIDATYARAKASVA